MRMSCRPHRKVAACAGSDNSCTANSIYYWKTRGRLTTIHSSMDVRRCLAPAGQSSPSSVWERTTSQDRNGVASGESDQTLGDN